jgi:hypothetical protein
MAFLSVTRLRVRSLRFLPPFFYFAFTSARQARRARGNLGSDLLADSKRTFWTATAWEDEASMRAFMIAPPHRRAMPRLLDWCDEAAAVHWLQDGPDLPDWREAHRRMVAEGRPSKVRHPSPAQEAFEIPPPKR